MTQQQALDIMKTGANIFLTGEPGAGKTHTINAYVQYLQEHTIYPAITASTGIAATHIGGVTIHSWTGIGIRSTLTAYDLDRIASNEYIVKRIKKSSVLIIDEVSMLSPAMLAMIDAVCREIRRSDEPFGGLQTILVGDFFQLPPVHRSVTQASEHELFPAEKEGRFAYDAPIWERSKFIVCYLTEQHRQDDDAFLSILTAIRNNTFGEDHFASLSSRTIDVHTLPDNTPHLFSHNADVNKVNDEMLETIDAVQERFVMSSSGAPALIEMLKKGCLSPETLLLKIGAEVMCTKNNPQLGFANGTLGTVIRFASGTRYPVVALRDGRQIVVEPMNWVVEENGKIRAEIKQIPLRLAWAITIHKSQGMSMDEAIMDLASVFEYGQGYVALSRVRRLSGLYLLGWNDRTFQVDADVLSKDADFRAISEEAADAFAKIGSSELKKMHDNFLISSGGTVDVVQKTAMRQRGKSGTTTETLGLWKEGKTIAEIARIRTIKSQTVFTHIESLAASGKISSDEIMTRLSPHAKKELDDIMKAFLVSPDGKLTPIFEHFGEKYSFDDLRLVRMISRMQ